MSKPSLRVSLAFFVFAALPGAARAAQQPGYRGDWFASIFTAEGVELRPDERVFTLFALLNAMGYDEGPLTRELPIPRHQFTPLRSRVRSEMLRLDPEVRQRAEAFFDSHPYPVARYLAYAESLAGPPDFARLGSPDKELQGLEELLRACYERGGLQALFGDLQDEYRASLKAYQPLVDPAIAEARRLLGLREGELSRLVVVPNLLDKPGSGAGAALSWEQLVVVGPSAPLDLRPLVRELARMAIAPQAAQKEELKGAAAAYLAETLARAVALKATSAQGVAEAELQAETAAGFPALREALKLLDETRGERSIGAMVAELAGKYDFKKGPPLFLKGPR